MHEEHLVRATGGISLYFEEENVLRDGVHHWRSQITIAESRKGLAAQNNL